MKDCVVLVKDSKEKLHSLNMKDVVRAQSLGDYVLLFTKSARYIKQSTTKDVVDDCEGHLLRVHRSHAVGISHIAAWEANRIAVRSNENPGVLFFVPLGRAYKKEAKKLYTKYLNEKKLTRPVLGALPENHDM